ncbi:hypothetical protein L484_022595 [Morus notabilis]|uniref:Uncharacterized protein n=1 Tax=Morus notabilis TaxID=981085 RepID=W9R8E0_9ROSA|nr:hypothetical protein L484_022595 [Morus notabilis]
MTHGRSWDEIHCVMKKIATEILHICEKDLASSSIPTPIVATHIVGEETLFFERCQSEEATGGHRCCEREGTSVSQLRDPEVCSVHSCIVDCISG